MIDADSIRERVADDDTTESMRAAVYARTSSTSREFGYSLDAQIKRGIDRCESLGWVVTFIYSDEAESGKDTDRPMFKQMLSMAEKRAFDVIVFWKLDRFSRSLMHAVQLESELRQSDVYLYSVTEQIDTTTATGRFNFRNIASAAEFERDMIKQRTQIGLHGLAEENRWPNDSPPLGYELTDANRLSILEEESALVVEIFEMYLEEHSMPAVAERLNRRGMSTTERGDWTARAVGDVLRNDIYRGHYELGEVSEHVPEYRIIDDELFDRVTDIRMRFKRDSASRSSMPLSRKARIAQAIKEQYSDYLDSCR